MGFDSQMVWHHVRKHVLGDPVKPPKRRQHYQIGNHVKEFCRKACLRKTAEHGFQLKSCKKHEGQADVNWAEHHRHCEKTKSDPLWQDACRFECADSHWENRKHRSPSTKTMSVWFVLAVMLAVIMFLGISAWWKKRGVKRALEERIRQLIGRIESSNFENATDEVKAKKRLSAVEENLSSVLWSANQEAVESLDFAIDKMERDLATGSYPLNVVNQLAARILGRKQSKGD